MTYNTQEIQKASPYPAQEQETATPGKVDTEVVPKKKRNYYTANYKLRILKEVDQCTDQGQIGALLRREGLYSSNLTRWRLQREQGALNGLSQKRGCKKSDNGQENQRIRELESENAKLKIELQKAETIIEFQKKISELLERPSTMNTGDR